MTPWPLRLPGLRRYGRRLQQLETQLRESADKVEGLRDRARADRADFADRIQEHKGRQLSPDVLRQVLGPRLHALVARTDDEAVAREAAFLQHSPSYAEARNRTADAAHVTIEGVSWAVPRDAGVEGDLADRILRDRWLPFHDILATRELAVGSVMLDIGANIGTTSIPRVILGDFVCVYAAEPHPDNYACLVENVAANRLQGRVLPDRVALSASEGSATLRSRPQIGVHHLVQQPAGPEDIAVPSVTLDGWVTRLGIDPYAINFVKVDTQGWETDVLRGGASLLGLPHIAWQLEFSPRLMKRSGATARDLLDLIEPRFTHFIDLGRMSAPRARPIDALREAVADVERRERRFTDLLLYSGSPVR